MELELWDTSHVDAYTPRTHLEIASELMLELTVHAFEMPYYASTPAAIPVQLDWSEFSVHLPEKDIPDLHHILGNITEERFAQMQVGCP
jgi:hypothetical protein